MKLLTIIKILLANVGAWSFIGIADIQALADFMQIMEPVFKNAAYMSGTMLSLGSLWVLFFKKKKDG